MYWNESSRGPLSFLGTEMCDLWKENKRAETVLRRLRQVFIAVFSYLVAVIKKIEPTILWTGQQKDKGKCLLQKKFYL